MKHRAVVLLCALGCAPDPAEDGWEAIGDDPSSVVLPDVAAAPPLALEIEGDACAIPGGTVTYEVTGSAPGSLVVLYGGMIATGAPLCVSQAGGLCLELGRGARLLGADVSDSGGLARIEVDVPALQAPLSGHLQAISAGGGQRGLSSLFPVDIAIDVEVPDPDILTFGSITIDPITRHAYRHVETVGTDFATAVELAALQRRRCVPGHLATLSTDDEADLVAGLLPGATAIIGGVQHPAASEPAGGWGWVTGEPWTLTNRWAAGEPNNSPIDEDTLNLRPDGTFNDRAASVPISGFVLEWAPPLP